MNSVTCSLDAAERCARIERLVAAAHEELPGEETPCFAHLRLRTERGVRDLLLGAHGRVGAGVTVLDWQTAPLAEAFFSYAEGDEYEIDVDGRLLAGTVLERSLLWVERGRLSAMTTPSEMLLREGDGTWRTVREPTRLPLLPVDDVQRASPIEAPLDDVQRRAVEQPAGRAMLVLGEAGCGKTTVAVHRVAFLHRQARQTSRRFRAAVVVPTEGLRRFTRMMLDRMGLERVEVWFFAQWAARQARRTFPDLPQREGRDDIPGVLKLKRHPSLRVALAACAARIVDGGRPLLHATRMDLLHVFGDRRLLEQVAAASAGVVTPGNIADSIAHTRVQFSDTTEQAWAQVDAERLQTIDGRAIDDGTPTQDAGSIDSEDYAVLFELDRLRAPIRGVLPSAPPDYDCLVLDEAQELAPLELALAGRSLAPGGTLVVAGDAGQQVDSNAFFVDWPTTMKELGADEHDAAVLETSYRCPPDVTALARRVLGLEGEVAAQTLPEVSGEPPLPPRSHVAFHRYANECHLVAAIGDTLRELRLRVPRATVAIIARTPVAARRLARLLERAIDVHLALAGDFRFGPGINVTCVEEVKGLEFDYVLLPDASAAAYPDAHLARRALYVAVTRTVRQLVLATVGTPSSLIAGDSP